MGFESKVWVLQLGVGLGLEFGCCNTKVWLQNISLGFVTQLYGKNLGFVAQLGFHCPTWDLFSSWY